MNYNSNNKQILIRNSLFDQGPSSKYGSSQRKLISSKTKRIISKSLSPSFINLQKSHNNANKVSKITVSKQFSVDIELKCKYLIQAIEQQAGYFYDQNVNDGLKQNSQTYQKFKLFVLQNSKRIIQLSKSILSNKRNQIIISLLSCLTSFVKDNYLHFIPMELVKQAIMYFKKQLDDLVGIKINKLSQVAVNTQKDQSKSKHLSSKQKQSITDRFKIKLSKSQHNSKTMRTARSHQLCNRVHKTSNQQENFENKQKINFFVQQIAMNRFDRVIKNLFIRNQKDKKIPLFIQKYPQILDALSQILQKFEYPIIKNKINLFLRQIQFEQFQRNIAKMKNKCKQLSQIVVKQKLKIQKEKDQKEGITKNYINQAQSIKKQIYQLIAEQFLQGSQNNHKNSLDGNPILKLFNFKSSAGVTQIPDEINQYIQLKQKSSSNSLSINSSTHSKLKNKSNSSLKQKDGFKQKDDDLQQIKQQEGSLRPFQSKGMNYKKINPIRPSIVGQRLSLLTNSIKNGHINSNYQNKLSDTIKMFGNQSCDQNFSRHNTYKSSKNNTFGQNILSVKATRMVQRRSGFVGLSRKKQSSTKRISTRWNNSVKDKDGIIIPNLNVFNESFDKAVDETKEKRQIKSNFSLGRDKNKNKMKTLVEKQISSSESSDENQTYRLKKKQSNLSSISIIGQTYNFLNFDNGSPPMFGSKYTSLTLSNKNIVVIDQKFQQIRRKLFYLRLMTLLNTIFFNLIQDGERKSKKQLIQNRNLSNQYTHNRDSFRKKTFYEQKYIIDKIEDNLRGKITFKNDHKINQYQRKERKDQRKIQKRAKRYFLKKQEKVKKVMQKYLVKKQKMFQQNFKLCLKSMNIVEPNEKFEKKFMKVEQELIIKPFHLFLDNHERKTQIQEENQFNQVRIYQKHQLLIFGNNQFTQYKKLNKQLSQNWTELSLKYQNPSEQDQSKQYQNKQFLKGQKNQNQSQKGYKFKTYNNFKPKLQLNKKTSAQNYQKNQSFNKQSLSIIQPFYQKKKNRILEFPIRLFLKSIQSVDQIYFKNIKILISVTIQPNQETQNKSLQSIQEEQKEKDKSLQKTKNIKGKSSFKGLTAQQIYKLNKQQGYQQDSEQEQSSFTSTSSSTSSQQVTQTESQNQNQNNQNGISQKNLNQNGSDKDNLTQFSEQSSVIRNQSDNSQKTQRQKRLNRSVSIDSSVSSQKLIVNQKQPNQKLLRKGRIKMLKKQEKKIQKMIRQQQLSRQDFYQGYFSIEDKIKLLLQKYLKIQKTDMGTKVQEKLNKNVTKNSFQSKSKNDKNLTMSLKNKIKIPNNSPTLKQILSALPKTSFQFQQFLSGNSINQQQKHNFQNSDFFHFNIEFKIMNQTQHQKASDKKLIRQKYNIQTSKKSVIQLGQTTIIPLRTYQKLSLIRKINTYFFEKNIFTIAQKISQQNNICTLEIFCNEEIYCDKFHELYEREVFQLDKIRRIKFSSIQFFNKQFYDKKLHRKNFFMSQKFKKMFWTQRLHFWKKYCMKSFDYQQVIANRFINIDYKIPETTKTIFIVKIEQIPQNCSKAQYKNFQVIQYFSSSENLNSVGFAQFHLLNHPVVSVENKQGDQVIEQTEKRKKYMQQKNGKSSNKYSQLYSSSSKVDQAGNLQLQYSKSRLKQQSQAFYFPQKPLKVKKSKRTTIQINKLMDSDDFSNNNSVFQKGLERSSSNKEKKIIGFFGSSFLNSNDSLMKFPTQSGDNAFQTTQKQITRDTQKSLKSHQSRSRLQRNGHHISSIMPTSSKAVKSIKNIEANINNPTCKKKVHLSKLNISLNCQSTPMLRKKQKKRNIYTYDNFFQFKQVNINALKQENQMKNNKKKEKTVKDIQLQKGYKKFKFSQEIKSCFKTTIKRLKKYLICYVYWKLLNINQYEIHILTGIYEKNPNYLKKISGKIGKTIFERIIQSHQSLQNYINCEIDSSFQIKSKWVKSTKILQSQQKSKQNKIKSQHNQFQNSLPLLSIQKLIKTRLIAKFIKVTKTQDILKKSRVNNTNQRQYTIISIFVFQEFRNEQVYFHVYTPKNGKTIVFVVQESIFCSYMKLIVDQNTKQKNLGDSIKISLKEKQSLDQVTELPRKRKPRLSIFNPLKKSQSNFGDSQEQSPEYIFQAFDTLQSYQVNHEVGKSTNTLFSIIKKSSSAWSSQREQWTNKKFQHPRIWDKQQTNQKELIQSIRKHKKRIKVHKYFDIRHKQDLYFLEFTENQNINQVQGIQAISKRIHFQITENEAKTGIILAKNNKINLIEVLRSNQSVKFTRSNKNSNITIIPKAIELLSLKYQQKKLSLLSSFSYQSFPKVQIKQNFIKYDTNLEHSHYSCYTLDQLLLSNDNGNKNNDKKFKFNSFNENMMVKMSQVIDLSNSNFKGNKQSMPIKGLQRSHFNKKKQKVEKQDHMLSFTSNQQAYSKSSNESKDIFSKTLPGFASNLIISLLDNGLSDSAIRRFNPLNSKYKSILYSDLIQQFRQRCQYNEFQSVQRTQKQKKQKIIYIKEKDFSVDIESNSRKNNQEHYNEIEQYHYFKIEFKRQKRIVNEQNYGFKNMINSHSIYESINVQINNFLGQNICRLQSSRLNQLYPYVDRFGNKQLRKFLSRIVKDNKILDYLRVKQQK